MNIAVIGCGYWGRNYLRVFSELLGVRRVIAVDASPANLGAAAERFGVRTEPDVARVLAAGACEAVVIATPANTHAELVGQALRAGRHVLVEKPLTTTAAAGEALLALAQRERRVLMVGHTFLYNPAVLYLRERIAAGGLGQIHYLTSQRTNLGPFRQDVNAVWDLAAHDVAIFNYLLQAEPEWVNAVGVRCLHTEREDAAFLTLGYPGGVVGHIHVSWADPLKVRQVVVVGSEARIVFDDTQTLERVKIFEKGVGAPFGLGPADGFGEFQFVLRDGDIVSPRLENAEPLKMQCDHFLRCVTEGMPPRTDGAAGVAVVRVLEAVDCSMRRAGERIAIAKRSGVSS